VKEIERVINEARERYESAESIVKKQLVASFLLSKKTINKAIEITSVSKEKYIAQEVKRYIKANYVRKEDLPDTEEIKEFLRELLHNWHMSEEKYHLKEIDIHQHTQDQLDFMKATARAIAKRIGKEG